MHYGRVTAGPLGTNDENIRAESTLMGDNINLASRIESLSKKYGTYTLLTDELYQNLSSDRKKICRMVDYVTVKGREKRPLRIYTIDRMEKSADFLRLYNEGQENYLRGDWSKAFDGFSRAAQLEPEDGPVQAMLKRIQSSRYFSINAIKHLSQKCSDRIEGFSDFQKAVEGIVSREPFTAPLGFIDRGGFWRWEEK